MLTEIQAVFLILGAATVAWGICTFFLLPDTPSNAWFLSKSDQAKAVVRVKENLTGIKSNEFKWSQFLEAITDIKAWLLFAINLAANIPNGAVTSVSPRHMPCHLPADQHSSSTPSSLKASGSTLLTPCSCLAFPTFCSFSWLFLRPLAAPTSATSGRCGWSGTFASPLSAPPSSDSFRKRTNGVALPEHVSRLATREIFRSSCLSCRVILAALQKRRLSMHW